MSEIASKKKVMTTREVAESLGTDKKVIIENARKYLPNKVFIQGKTTFWTEEELTILIDRMKNNNSNQYREKGSVTGAVTVASTDLTPALMIKQAMELAQKGYELELERIKAEKAKLKAEKEKLQIELDTSKEWYSIKRMEKLNPDKKFSYSILKAQSLRMGKEIKKVFDANYGEVNAYHRSVWEALYFDAINYDETRGNY